MKCQRYVILSKLFITVGLTLLCMHDLRSLTFFQNTTALASKSVIRLCIEPFHSNDCLILLSLMLVISSYLETSSEKSETVNPVSESKFRLKLHCEVGLPGLPKLRS